MVRYPATRKETRGESVPNTPYPVDISTEVMRKHATQISPHKPILCRGLCGEGACVTVAVAMDHPSRVFHFPSQVDEIHEQSVPYGWGRCQLAHMSSQPRSHASSGWSLKSTDQEERDATSHVETLGSTQSTRRTDCPQDLESKTVCVFAPISP